MPRDAALEAEALELFQALLRIDTTNPPGHERAAAELLAESLRKDGLEPQLLEKLPGRTNLVARLKGDGSKPPLLLTGHLDVVAAEDGKWTHPPFGAEIHDGWLWGRGALDMKNMVAMSAMILKALKRSGTPLKRDLIFAAVADEEDGCENGSIFLSNEHADLVKAEFALGEIGGFTLRMGGARLYPVQVAHKGMAWIRASVKGTPGHGSLPREDQAVHKLALALARLGHQKLPVHVSKPVRAMIEGIKKVQPLTGKIGLSLLTRPLFTEWVLETLFPDKGIARSFNALLRNTAVATVVKAGYKTNVIPGEAEALIDGRVLPGQSTADLLRELRNVLGDDVDLAVQREMAPLEMPTESALVDAIRTALHEADPAASMLPYVMPGFTDGGPFSKLGVLYYGFAPVFFPETPAVSFAELYHGHDERIPVEGFFQGLAVLRDVVTRFCT
ncbi:MAG: M20/M25/M40 family metallo-hydrolase [Deltaproteobacteria bacterium]|nr:M20/M25/M40 family metallo-hydrolase [Deltaproteobacteria bacterium]